MTQTLLTIFIPSLLVLVGILINRNDANRLETRIGQVEGRLDGRLSQVEARITGLDSRLHTDMLTVIGKLTELEVRVAKLETQRQ
jgi:hypothetical protein